MRISDWSSDVCSSDLLHDSRGNLVRAGGKRVSILGMDNIAVIVDGDDILVIPLERSQEVRAAAQARESSGRRLEPFSPRPAGKPKAPPQTGSASCWERMCHSVYISVFRSLIKK